MLQREIVGDGRGKSWRRGVREFRLSSGTTNFLVVPGRFVIALRRIVKTGVQAVLRQFETLLNNECGIRIVDEIVLRNSIVPDGVIHEPAKKSDVCSRAYLQEQIRGGRRSSETGIDDNHLRVTDSFCFNGPLEATGMVF